MQGDDIRSSLQAVLEQLRLKLLDLTGRNRLLNFRHTPGRSLQSVEGSPQVIYERLVETNGKITIRGVPEPHRSDWIVRDGRYVRPDVAEWAAVQRIPTSYEVSAEPGEATFRALLYPEDLAKHCRKLEREARLAIEETGANMLFLVLGFLQFPDQQESDRSFLAPLISVPVSLSRPGRDSQRTFEIEHTGDDIAANLSLYEKLRVDYELTLPDFDEEHPDVEAYFKDVARAVQGRPGFDVKRRVTLCLLSFTNMLLVRDLDPGNWPTTREGHALLDHPVINKLLGVAGLDDDSRITEPPAHEVDEEPGSKIPLVFDADSSQHRALIDVLQGKRSLVIEGPPGTGKSQTITNLIAACIREGKTVLFVAEKLAALEVVKSRLSAAGLDPFALELHSSKTSKKRVLEELGRRLTHRVNAPSDLARKLDQLERHRQALRSYATLLKSVTHNSLGLTLHDLIWRAEHFRLELTSEIALRSPPNVRDASKLTSLMLSVRLETLKHLADQFTVIGRFEESSPFWGFYPEELLPGDEHVVQRLLEESRPWLDAFVSASESYCVAHQGPAGLSLESAQAQLGVLQTMLVSVPPDGPLHLVPRFFSANSTVVRVKELVERVGVRLARYRELHATVQAGLRNESDGTVEQLEALRHLEGLLRGSGVASTNVKGVIGTAGRIKDAAEGLRDALATAQAFCESRGLHFAGTRDDISRLSNLCTVAVGLPERHWKLFGTILMNEASTAALEVLDAKQRQWQELHTSLDGRVYLDPLPDPGAVRAAVLTLREGSTWYRVFQQPWRQARALHRRLQRQKTKISAEEQLAELETIQKYLDLRERWRSDPGWSTYCQRAPAGDPIDLSGYLAISRWYDEMRSALRNSGIDQSRLPRLARDQIAEFRRGYSDLDEALKRATRNVEEIDDLMPRLRTLGGGQSVSVIRDHAAEFSRAVGENLRFFSTSCAGDIAFADCLAACDAAVQRRAIGEELTGNAGLKQLLADQYRGIETDVTAVLKVIDWGQQVQSSALPPQIRHLILGVDGLRRAQAVSHCLQGMINGLSQAGALERRLQDHGPCDLAAFAGQRPDVDIHDFAQRLRTRIASAIESVDSLVDWSKYVARRGEALAEDLLAFVGLLERRQLKPEELPPAYGYAALASIVRGVFRDPVAGAFSGLKHSQIQADFCRFDKEIIAKRGLVIADACLRSSAPPAGRSSARVDEKTEMALLNHLLPQQRPRIPVRQMLARASRTVQILKPCLMMGPHAVAQFLKPGGMSFDVIVMDEASQLSPEEAIGAAARGRQLVVVGDSKQLPPTNFFRRQSQLGDEPDEYTTTDAESILDICAETFRPSRSLLWHYRSRHHSLIAFSNRQFYDGRLIICPSPYAEGARLGVRATYVAHAIYDNQINPVEAKRVVDAVAEHIVTRPDETLGVVTLNIKQRDLISELLEERLRVVPRADEVRVKWREAGQDLFVKNLENVQGDERDCIIISTTFGRPPGVSQPRQNFGPISRQGGWRRLNVLFTRARNSVSIFTSLRPEDILIDGSTPDGTKALRGYLEYARSGQLNLPNLTDREPESDFERSVIEVLRRMNYEVTPQLGVSGFRIDVAVKHPSFPGAYLAAIECDGVQYHSAQSARDRDRIRQEILESQGWRGRIWRIWSTDWFRTPSQEAAKLKAFLDRLRETWQPEHTGGQSWFEEGAPPGAEPEVASEEQTAALRQLADQKLLFGEAEKEVRVGDVVDYAATDRGDDVRTVRITKRNTDIGQGLLAEHTPLAQALLGGVIGDEVVLSVPGQPKRVLRILAIKREATH